MKKKLIKLASILAILAIVYFSYKFISDYYKDLQHKEWVASLEHSASKNVQILKDTITVDYLNEKRTLSIYLPEKYGTDTIQYSVIYFLDGQSLFDQKILEGNEWEIDEVLDSLGNINQAQSIIVGIYNADDRLTEYKPFRSPKLPREKAITGDKHADWIVNGLKPWIDKRYRTKKETVSTFIGGASLGGLMSYYMLMEYPDVFGGAIVFSPSFWVNDKVYSLHEKSADWTKKKIYFNAGSLETPTVESIEKMYGILANAGMPKAQMKIDIEADEVHWHMSWRKGFRKAYPWIVE